MNKRKRLPYLILTILIVSILLLTSIGLSLWIISDKKEIKPELGVDKVLVQYLDNQKPTYTGDILLPSSNALDLNINNEDLTYYYKGESDPDFIKVDNSNPEDPKGPIDAGEYTIKVEYIYEVYEFDDELQKDVLVEKTFIKDNIQFEILKDIIRVEDFGFVYTKEYNTKEQTITHTAIPKGATSVSYTGSLTNVGTTTVTINIEYDSKNYQITENGENVNGVLSKTFKITPYNISKLSFKFEGNTNNPNNLFYYRSGNQVADLDGMFAAVHTLLDSTEVKVPKDQYTVSFPNYTTIGEYEATITALDKNYTSSTTIKYKIEASPLTIKFEGKSLVNQFYQFDFCNKAIDISSYIKVYDAYNTLLTNLSSLGISISYQYSANATNNYSDGLPTDAGLYQVKVIATVSGTPTLYANKEEVFNIQILAIPLSGTDVTATVITTYPYNNGNAITVGSDKFEVSHSTYSTLKYGTHYVIDTSKGSNGYDNNKDAGNNTAIVYLKFVGNFTGDFQTTFTITPVTPTVTPGTFSHIYYIEGQLPEPQSYGSATYNGSSVTSGSMSLTGYTHNGTNYNDLNSIEYIVNASMQQAVVATFTYTPVLNKNNVYNYNPAVGTTTLYFCAAAGNVTKKLYYPTIYDAIYNSSSGDKVWVVAGLDTINLINTGVDVKLIPELDKSVDIKSGVTFGLSYLTGTAQGATDSTAMQQGYYEFDDELAIADGQVFRPTDGIRTFMKIKSGVELTANSGGTLVVGGYLHYDSVIENPTVIMNDGIITIESGGVMNSYGFTKGQGAVHLEDGSICNDSLRIYDFVGTRWAVGLYFDNIADDSSKNRYNYILPFKTYTMHNISCDLYIHSGSKFITTISMGINNITYINKVTMIGENALFGLTTPATYDSNHNITNGYIKRTVENTTNYDPIIIGEGSYNINGDYYSTNHSPIQKEVYEVYSNVEDNAVNIHLAMNVLDLKEIDMNIVTSSNVYFPICMMDMTLKSGFTANFNSNSYKFLPGSKLTIEEGSTIITGKDTSIANSKAISMVFYDEYDDRITAHCSENGFDYKKSEEPYYPFSFWYLHQSFYKKDTNTDTYYLDSNYQSYLINNGNAIFEGNIAGIIKTTSEASNITTATNNSTVKEVTHLEGMTNADIIGNVITTGYLTSGVQTKSTFEDKVYNLRIYMKNGDLVNTNLSTPAVGSYTSYRDASGKYGWRPRYINININLNGGRTVNGDVGIFTISNVDTSNSYIFTREIFNELGIYRTGYSIGKITYNDQSGDEVDFNKVLYEDMTIFIEWLIDTYTITYQNKYDSSVSAEIIGHFGDSSFTSNPNITSITILDTLPLKQPSIVYNETTLSFEGWFNNPECSGDPITSLEKISSDITLYAYWIESDEAVPFTVVYNGPSSIPDGSGITSQLIAIPDSESGQLINNTTSFNPASGLWSNINNIETITHYMDTWYLDANCEQKFSKDAFIELVLNSGENPTINLYSKLSQKVTVTYKYKDGTQKGNVVYVTPGASIDLPTYSYKSDDSQENYIVFNNTFKWTSSLGGEYSCGDEISITETVTFTENYISIYYYKMTISVTYATVTVTVGSTENDKYIFKEKSINATAYHEYTAEETLGTKTDHVIYIKVGETVTYAYSYPDGYEKDSTSPNKESPFTMGSQVYTITAKGKEKDGCIAAGTLITLADGTKKPVEKLTVSDLLLVFNHETGKYETANIIFIDNDGWDYYDVLNLLFSDGYSVKVIYEHGFFDLDLGKYVYISPDNYNEFIGHRFALTDVIDGRLVEKVVILEEAYVQEEYTGCYSPVTVYHLNYFTNGLLSMPGGITGLFNMFEFNDDMTINKELMEQDIEKYGLYTYEDFEPYIPYEIYELFPAPYLKVAVGKEIVTFEEILGYIERYLEKMLDSQDDN